MNSIAIVGFVVSFLGCLFEFSYTKNYTAGVWALSASIWAIASI